MEKTMNKLIKTIGLAIVGLFSTILVANSVLADGHSNEVNIFSARHYDSDVQLYEKFTAKTGIKVNVVSGKSGALEKRIIAEAGTADLYITADAGRLGAFEANLQSGLTSPNIKSCLLYTSPSPRDRTRSRMPSSA